MIDTVVYTYKKLDYSIYKRSFNQIEWIKRSTTSAKKLGYRVELYTDDKELAKELILDEIHYIVDTYRVWDSFKLWVLEHRKDDNYFLSDSDVIFNKKINFDYTKDISFDGVEVVNWNWVYRDTLKYLEQNNVIKGIKFWKYSQIPVFNVGILRINNKELKLRYLKYWKEAYAQMENYIDSKTIRYIAPILTQYLLTLICEDKKYSTQFFTSVDGWPNKNEYYNHFPGLLKFKNQQVI